MRKIRTIGLLATMAMVLAASAGTSGAMATSTFTAEEAGQALSTVTVVNHAFFITGNEFFCDELDFAGETEGTSTVSQSVSPEYDDCHFSSLNANVIENGCNYTFKAETDGEHATVNLFGCDDPTKGIQIEVSVPFLAKCLTDIPQQSIAQAVHYTNTTPEGQPMSVDFEFTMSGIMVDVTTSTGLCPLTPGTHEGENGMTYTGVTSFTAAGGLTWSA